MAERRKRRTKEEIVAELETKIQYHQNCITALEEKKAKTLQPRKRAGRKGLKSVLAKAKEMGMTTEEIAKKLGVSLAEDVQ